MGCGEESGSGQEEGGVASVIVCMVARAQWLSAAYTRGLRAEADKNFTRR